MKEKIVRYKYSIIFLLYCIAVFYLSKNAELVFEWKVIMQDFATYHDYYYEGKPTAYMPPLYPYYLLLIENICKIPQWVMISCVLQSLIFFFSVLLLVRSFEENDRNKNNYFLAFVCIIFCPPILLGVAKISSFALTVSIFCAFFALVLKLSKQVTLQNIVLIAIVSVMGLYIRYEFLFLMIISAAVLFLFKKIKYYSFLFLLAFIFITYLPWCMRNYEKIGTFHYSTSLSYNFAKGNHEKYDIFSTSNFPYDPSKKLILFDDYLRSHYDNEKQIDNYLNQLNKDFVSTHPKLFIENSFKKIGINFLNYYPGNYNFSSNIITYLYSIVLVAFNLIFLYILYKKLRSAFTFETTFLGILFIFYLLFYSVAPLPRYFLFYFPLFFLFTYQDLSYQIQLSLLKQKK